MALSHENSNADNWETLSRKCGRGAVAINYAPINERAKLERALPQLRRQIHQILNLGHHAPATIANAFDLV